MANRPFLDTWLPKKLSEAVSTTLEDRVILVLREAEVVYGIWQVLAEQTGIAAARWRKVYTSQQRPTPDMIQAICRLKPEYAFWIGTGITDAENGHKAPTSALPFPEWRGARASDQAAIDYFRASLELLDVLALAGKTNGEDQGERLYAFGLQRMKRQWWASSLAAVANALSLQDDYKELKRLRTVRQSLRARDKLKRTRKPAERERPNSGGRLPPEERVDPSTQHMAESNLFWSNGLS